MDPYTLAMFILFIAMLGGLLVAHHHKLSVVVIGFAVLGSLFVWKHGLAHFGAHFMDHHRSHLLINLTLLLPGFALVAYHFEHSGASGKLAKKLASDLAVLWVVFWLSTILDNIAAAMIGGTIAMARYGKNPPFELLVGIIGASNLGGAGSPVGDTTTVMLFISEDPKIPVGEIFKGFVASLPAMVLLGFWAVSGNGKGNGADHEKELEQQLAYAATHEAGDVATGDVHVEGALEGVRQHGFSARQMLPLLGVPGLIAGNFLNQPGLGLWAGIAAGLLRAHSLRVAGGDEGGAQHPLPCHPCCCGGIASAQRGEAVA